MNLASWILLAVVAVCFAAAVRRMIRSGGGCGCGGCSGCSGKKGCAHCSSNPGELGKK